MNFHANSIQVVAGAATVHSALNTPSEVGGGGGGSQQGHDPQHFGFQIKAEPGQQQQQCLQYGGSGSAREGAISSTNCNDFDNF